MALSKQDRKEMKELVKEVVNGKIDRLERKLDAHTEEIQPMMDLVKGSIVARKVILWVTSIIIALASAYLSVKGIFKL